MGKLTVTPIREEDVIMPSALILLKGGVLPSCPANCAANKCGSNIAGCSGINECGTNNVPCGVNTCETNLLTCLTKCPPNLAEPTN